LKQFLIEIKNVLEGNSERIVRQTQEYLDNKDRGKTHPTNPEDTLALFGLIQKPLNENREREKFYKGKTDRDVEIQNKFNANVDQGRETFDRISQTSNRSGFHFYSSRGEQSADSLGSQFGNPQLLSNSQIIQDIKRNPGD